MVRTPRQGDILLLNTAPRSGYEQTGKHPYIVLSHDIIAENSNVVTVAFISTTNRNYPLYVPIRSSYGMKTVGKVLLDQLTTIDYEARQCVFLEKAHKGLVDELLQKAKLIFQKVNN